MTTLNKEKKEVSQEVPAPQLPDELHGWDDVWEESSLKVWTSFAFCPVLFCFRLLTQTPWHEENVDPNAATETRVDDNEKWAFISGKTLQTGGSERTNKSPDWGKLSITHNLRTKTRSKDWETRKCRGSTEEDGGTEGTQLWTIRHDETGRKQNRIHWHGTQTVKVKQETHEHRGNDD